MTLETIPYRLSDLAQTIDERAAVLTFLLSDEEGGSDISTFLSTLGNLAREHGMSGLAKDIGVSRERLYKSLNGKTEPRFRTVAAVLENLGFALTVVPRPKDASSLASEVQAAE